MKDLMHIAFYCPSCQHPVETELVSSASEFQCVQCGWGRPIAAGAAERDPPTSCLVCGCEDLWRQKDFPQKLGLAMVALGAISSTIAWAWYMPATALGILLAFALVDMLLYTWMRDVLVCYRCGARYRRTHPAGSTPYFNLEVAERYRQEAQRLKETQESRRE